MSVFNPLFDPRAGAASKRRFDPTPCSYLSLSFTATARTSGRQFYKAHGRTCSHPSMLPGFTSVGGAGFGNVKRNGEWITVPANEPMIGDDGLEAWDNVGQNMNAQSGELTLANGWALSTGSPPSRTTGYFIDGLRATRFVTSVEVMAYRVYDETNATWISPIGGNNTATPYEPGRVSISVVAPTGCTALRIYPLRSQDNQTWTYKTFAVTPGQTYTARWLAAKNGDNHDIGAFEFRQGAELNDPPVQTGASPGTRTSVDWRFTGLDIQPTHYGVMRVFWGAPYGASAANFPCAMQARTTDGTNSWILWRRAVNAGSSTFFIRVNDNNIFGLSTPSEMGTWETVAWRCKGGDYAASLNGASLHKSSNASAMTSPIRDMGLLGGTYGSNTANGKMSDLHIWNADISDADLQALSARFTL